MNAYSSVFSQAEGITIQSIQVLEWKFLLRPEFHKYLDENIAKENDKLTSFNDGYDVFRGTDLDGYVHNELKQLAKINIK
jgi:hypothetical protein